jgi:hypothetical protein
MPALHKTEGGPPEQRSKRLPEYPFNEIHSPGSYLMVETGDLIRVPPEALAPGHSPMEPRCQVDRQSGHADLGMSDGCGR